MRYALVLLLAATIFAKTPRQIEERFLAPCCWSESVAFHNSPAASEMRAEIEKFVARGLDEDQIVDHYVQQYGERILREPRGSRKAWLTAGPIVAAAFGLIALTFYVRRARPAATAIPATAGIAPVRDEELDF